MRFFLNCDEASGRPAARVGDSVSCPIHGTAYIVTGSADTFHDDRAAARVGDRIGCGDTIIEGSNTVLINGKPASFVGCATAHGGTITSGSPNFFIGRMGGTQPVVSPADSLALNYSLAFDFTEMHAAGNHNGINYAGISIEITTPDGAYITTVTTDETGMSGRFFTCDKQDIIAWVVGAGEWEITEEYENEPSADGGEE
ncbi:hypothetical protein GMSM_46430 [Geomonas sp. Red276]